MTKIFDHGLHTLTFVKRGIIHANETFFRDVRQEDCFRTGYETYGNSGRLYQSINGVGSPFSAPIMLSIATLSFHRIAVNSPSIIIFL